MEDAQDSRQDETAGQDGEQQTTDHSPEAAQVGTSDGDGESS